MWTPITKVAMLFSDYDRKQCWTEPGTILVQGRRHGPKGFAS